MSTDLVLCVNSFAVDQSPEQHILISASPDQADTVKCLTAYYLDADISVDCSVPCQDWTNYCRAVRQRDPTAIFSTSMAASIRRVADVSHKLLHPVVAPPSSLPGILRWLLSTPDKVF